MKQEETAPRNYALEYDDSWSRYDLVVKLFQLGRDKAHRLRALRLAGLKKGDTMLDVCCGSGLSFKAVQSIIGPEGRIIAVDGNDHMLALAEKRARRNGWSNISFVSSDIGALQLDGKIDFALFALCWYDREICSGWVRHIAPFLKPAGRFCFIDYKLPENGLRYVVTPLIGILLKWLGEAYTLEDLKWQPREEIGSLLKDPAYLAYYLDCIVTVSGAPL